MPWLQLTLPCPQEEAENLSDLLFELSALSVSFEDAADNPIFEPAPGEVTLWEQTNVIALFDIKTDLSFIEEKLKALFPQALSYKKIEEIADKPWETLYLDSFQPIQIVENLWICPTWHKIPDRDAITILLDPGLAFGTGTHPTTQLCLKMLATMDLQDKIVIDYGCGSGILAIAAAKLGAKHVYAVDIHEQALEATTQNAITNTLSDKLTICLPRDLNVKAADVIVANILAEPLMQLSSTFIAVLKSKGYLVLSGLLETQVDDVIHTYQSLTLLTCEIMQEWACLRFVNDKN